MTTGDELARNLYRDGAARWPLVAVGFEAFREHCARVLGPAPDEEAERHGAELYLCCACAGKDREGMATLEREGASVARHAIVRVNQDPEFVRETMQVIWDQLLGGPTPKIASYSGRGPLRAWLRVVAIRTAFDRCRARRVGTRRHVELMDHLAADGGDPEVLFLRSRYAGAFQEALCSALSDLPSKDRNLLRLHLEAHCGIDQIGQAYGVHRATAARWLERARARVFESARSRLAVASPRMTESEFRSVARVVGMDLELSLTASEGALLHDSRSVH